LPQNGTIGEKHQWLLYALESENVYSLMSKLVASTNMDSTFVEVESAIPCIMHGGNRIGEIIFRARQWCLWHGRFSIPVEASGN
jgi:hypothetical protein